MKRLQKGGFRIIYPHYLDSKRSRAEGRRVSTEYATPMPALSEMTAALGSLGIKYEVQESVAFPRDHTKKSYRVIVFSNEKKSALLDRISRKLRGI